MKIVNIIGWCVGQEPAESATDTAAPMDNRTGALPAGAPSGRRGRITPQIWDFLVSRCGTRKHRATPDDNDGDDESNEAATSDRVIRNDGFRLRRFSFEDSVDEASVAGTSIGKAASEEAVIPPNKYFGKFSFETEKEDDFNLSFKTLPSSIVTGVASSNIGHIPPFAHPPFKEREYLTRHELADLMPSGRDAERGSGLVSSHIKALKDVASQLDIALAFRKVNPAAKYWIQHDFPVKGLTVKSKSEKTGPLQGLLLTHGKSGAAVGALDGILLGSKLEEMISNNNLKVLENTAEEDSDPMHYVLKVRDPESLQTYKMKFNVEDATFSVFKLEDDEFKPVKFRSSHGKPLTADYDAFDFYPRLKNKNFAGTKDIDTRAIEKPTPHFVDLVDIVSEQVLELRTVRKAKEGLGRLNDWDAHIIKACNDEIKKQSGYPHDVLMHGKEKRNTNYPELCNEVFFIFPDRQTLMSTSWEQTQAVDYAIKQEGFVSTDNRAYNIPAGSQVLFHDQRDPHGEPAIPPASGKTIIWDSRAAAKKLYGDYKGSGKRVAGTSYGMKKQSTGKVVAVPEPSPSGSNAQLRTASRGPLTAQDSVASMISIASTSSTASMQNIPLWLNNLVAGPRAGTSTPASGNGTHPHSGSRTVPPRLLRMIREMSEDNGDDRSNDGEKS